MIRSVLVRAALFAVGGTVGAGLAGCSSSSELTARQYRARAQEECRAAQAQVRALDEPKAGDTAAQVRAGRAAVAIQRDTLGTIQSLDAPRPMEARVARWLDLSGQALDAAERSLTAQADIDLAAAEAANRDGAAAATEADTIARELGIPACAG